MKVSQHIPGFITGVNPINFDNIEASSLFNLEFIRSWKDLESFIRFIVSYEDYNEAPKLMCEIKDEKQPTGKSFWVIAKLTPLEEVKLLDLPEFNISDYRKT